MATDHEIIYSAKETDEYLVAQCLQALRDRPDLVDDIQKCYEDVFEEAWSRLTKERDESDLGLDEPECGVCGTPLDNGVCGSCGVRRQR